MNSFLTSFLFILMVFRLVFCNNNINMNCDFAISYCAKKTNCNLALHDFRISCKNEINGLVEICSQPCQSSIITLLAIEEGNQYLNCVCINNSHCDLFKERIKVCDKWLMNRELNINKLMDNHKSCYVNQVFCASNSICNLKYQNYRYLEINKNY
jgi:hypothetical protein